MCVVGRIFILWLAVGLAFWFKVAYTQAVLGHLRRFVPMGRFKSDASIRWEDIRMARTKPKMTTETPKLRAG